jgi:hypothetical protein
MLPCEFQYNINIYMYMLLWCTNSFGETNKHVYFLHAKIFFFSPEKIHVIQNSLMYLCMCELYVCVFINAIFLCWISFSYLELICLYAFDVYNRLINDTELLLLVELKHVTYVLDNISRPLNILFKYRILSLLLGKYYLLLMHLTDKLDISISDVQK